MPRPTCQELLKQARLWAVFCALGLTFVYMLIADGVDEGLIDFYGFQLGAVLVVGYLVFIPVVAASRVAGGSLAKGGRLRPYSTLQKVVSLALLVGVGVLALTCLVSWQPVVTARWASDAEQLERLVVRANANRDGGMLRALARNPNMPSELLTKIFSAGAGGANKWDSSVRTLLSGSRAPLTLVLAKNPRTEAAVLEKLSKGPIGQAIRVAVNPNSPEELLVSLAQHRDARVRRACARSAVLPAASLLTLARDTAVRVRAAVARNDRSPLEAQLLLSEDSEREVRWALVSDSRVPTEVLKVLEQDPDGEVRQRAQRWREAAMSQQTGKVAEQ